MTHRPTILIADDEPHITYMLAHKLGAVGFDVVTVRNGSEALAIASQRKPMLVITDFQMPVMTGFDMCEKLKENAETAHIPAIMLTARGHRLTPSELSRTNIRCLLAKPFSLREIIERVTEVLRDEGISVGDDQTSGAAAA